MQLYRVSGSYGRTYGSNVLVPMPSQTALKPGDFTGDAGSKNKALIRRERKIRVPKRVEYAFRANMDGSPDTATDMPLKRVNAGRHAAAERELLARIWAVDPARAESMPQWARQDKRSRSRIRAAARAL